MLRFLLVLAMAGLLAEASQAHYNMLLPQAAMVKKGDRVVFVYQWGHPFEHELFDAPAPTSVIVGTPDGSTQDVTKRLEKFKQPGISGKDVDAYRFTLTPQDRGDYWVVLLTPPIWMEAEQEFYQDFVQVMLHVDTQNGWDRLAPIKLGLNMVPLTRPYGLREGMVYQAELRRSEKTPDFALGLGLGDLGVHSSLENRIIEYERYNPQKPNELPIDELRTFKTQTDHHGVYTCTLPDPGWWCMTGSDKSGTQVRDGKTYPVRQRVSLWVHVDRISTGK